MNRQQRRASKKANRNAMPGWSPLQSMALASWAYATARGITDNIHKMYEREPLLPQKDHEAIIENASKTISARMGVSKDTAMNLILLILSSANSGVSHGSRIAILGEWYNTAMPTVTMSAKLASSLAVTSIGPKVLDSVRMPFNALRVLLPPDLLFAKSMHSVPEPLVQAVMGNMIDSTGKHVFTLHSYTSGGTEVFGHYETMRLFHTDNKTAEDLGVLDAPLEDMDLRSSLLLRRILLNTCILMTEGEGSTTSGMHGRTTRHGPPPHRRFILTQPVRHDFRKAVRQYSRQGKGRVTNIQCIVSGHWKMQPCGPGLLERKRIFVEPYWRGPEDAKIAMRPHVL